MLGDWDIKKVFRRTYNSRDIWIGNLQLPEGYLYEYKYAISDFAEEKRDWINWDEGDN